MNKQLDIEDVGTKQPQDFRPFSFLYINHKYHYGIIWLAKALDEASRRPCSLMLPLSDHILFWYDDFLNNNHTLFSLATPCISKGAASNSRAEVKQCILKPEPKKQGASNSRFEIIGLSQLGPQHFQLLSSYMASGRKINKLKNFKKDSIHSDIHKSNLLSLSLMGTYTWTSTAFPLIFAFVLEVGTFFDQPPVLLL